MRAREFSQAGCKFDYSSLCEQKFNDHARNDKTENLLKFILKFVVNKQARYCINFLPHFQLHNVSSIFVVNDIE